MAKVVLAPVLAVASMLCVYATVRPFGGAYLYFPLTAVWVSSLHGGLAPGLLTLALSLLGFNYLFLGEPGRLGFASAHKAHRLMEFALAGVTGGVICSRYRVARLAAHRADRETKRVGALQERLVAVVGHDLRTPLASLRMGVDVLQRIGPLGSRQRRVIGNMQRSARRMERLVEDLLGFARSRAGKGFPIVRQPSSLGAICARIVAEFQETSNGRPIRLSIEDDRPEFLDPARLEQVVANLISNAVKHGSPREPIDVSVCGRPDDLVLVVSNRGAPIPAALLPEIFRPLRSGSARGDGLGLGLFVVHEVVAAHGGHVSVHSDASRTTFEIHLPSARPADPVPASGRAAAGHDISAGELYHQACR